MLHTLRHLLMLLLAASLAACAGRISSFTDAPGGTAASLVRCCAGVERYPRWLVAVADPLAPVWGRIIAQIVWRRGYLSRPDAQHAVAAMLRPLDIVVLSSKGRLSGNAIPGRFGHVAIYLGTEAQLKKLGAWNDPRVLPFHDEVASGATLIEADYRGVHLSPAARVLNTDRVAVLRPRLPQQTRRRAVGAFFGHIGADFDFHFDASTADAVYCAELLRRILPELGLPVRRAYDRDLIVPDEIVAQALRGGANYDLVLYVKGRPPRWEFAPSRQLAADIGSAWPDQPD